MNDFEAMNKMSKESMDIRMAPLSNIVGMVQKKDHCQITFAVEKELMSKIVKKELTGGLYLMDKKQFFEIRDGGNNG